MSKVISSVCFAVLTLSSAALLFAQLGRGVIFGTISDSSGAPMAGVSVRVTNVDTGVTLTALTVQGGDYTTPGISPGNYRITVDQQGFKSLVRSGIEAITKRKIDERRKHQHVRQRNDVEKPRIPPRRTRFPHQ